MTQDSHPPIDLEALLSWETRFASIFQANPFEDATFERELRRLTRELQEGAGKSPAIIFENRIEIAKFWLQRFAPTARKAPPLWQSLYFGLLRFALDPQLETSQVAESKLPKIWGQLNDFGLEFEVPDSQKLLSIAERARRATRAIERIHGKSESVRQLKKQIWFACFGSDLKRLLVYEPLLQEHNVLILGPTGSGKELVAQVLLAAACGVWKGQKGEELQWHPHHTEALNLAEFPRELMAAQIVGYKRGSYTGAVQDFRGVLSRCDQGAVFLDEIGELPTEGQVVLLRALETKRVRPLGSPSTEKANCRVIAATHSALDQPAQAPDFRRDLFYRLAGTIIRVPPLFERREDILAIALGFLDVWGIKEHASLHLTDPRAQLTQWLSHTNLETYHWPGNVRELKRIAAQVLMGDEALLPNIPQTIVEQSVVGASPPSQLSYNTIAAAIPAQESSEESLVPAELVQGEWSMEELRQWYIRHVLELTKGHQKEAAERLKIHRTTIYHATRKEQDKDDEK